MPAEGGGRGERRHWTARVPDMQEDATDAATRRERAAAFSRAVALPGAGEAWKPQLPLLEGRVHRARVGDAGYGDAQVDRRRADVSKEAANEALQTAFSTQDVVSLRRSAEAGWRGGHDAGRLQPRVVRTYSESLSRAQRELEQARATEDTTELREVGLEAVKTANEDTLRAMAVHAAAQEGVDVNTRAESAAGEEPTRGGWRVRPRRGSWRLYGR